MAVDDPDADADVEAPARTGSARVSTENLTKHYDGAQGTVRALEDVSFEVETGEFVCIVGPSGSGKTTLFRIIAGLDDATAGTVYLNDNPVEGPTPNMGVVFQEYHLFPWRTVRGNVGFGLEQGDASRAARRRRVEEMLDLVGLEAFGDSYPKSLSGGMKQRVALARSLAVGPDLLLMDEPFGALDAQTKGTLQDELLDIWQETGKTILFVTHDVEEAVKLADRIVVLTSAPGRIREVVHVELPRPRSLADAEFGEYYERVLGLIRN